MVVFDFSHMSSFQNAEQWKEDVAKYVKEPLIFLVGTQKDIVVSNTLIADVPFFTSLSYKYQIYPYEQLLKSRIIKFHNY